MNDRRSLTSPKLNPRLSALDELKLADDAARQHKQDMIGCFCTPDPCDCEHEPAGMGDVNSFGDLTAVDGLGPAMTEPCDDGHVLCMDDMKAAEPDHQGTEEQVLGIGVADDTDDILGL